MVTANAERLDGCQPVSSPRPFIGFAKSCSSRVIGTIHRRKSSPACRGRLISSADSTLNPLQDAAPLSRRPAYPLAVEMPRSSNADAIRRVLVTRVNLSSSILGEQISVSRSTDLQDKGGTVLVVANFIRMSTPPRPLPERPDDTPRPGPSGPRTPYPVNDPGFADPGKPGSEPDYIPSPSPPGIAPEI
jgi:hypothetical protein